MFYQIQSNEIKNEIKNLIILLTCINTPRITTKLCILRVISLVPLIDM